MFKVRVKDSEKALLFKDEKFVKVLDSGVYSLFNLFKRYNIKKYPLLYNGISGSEAVALIREYPDMVKEYFNVVNLDETKRAFISIDGKIEEILNVADVKLYWKELDVKAIYIDVKKEYKVSNENALHVESFTTIPKGIKLFSINSYEEGYLFVNGKFIETLNSGKHYFFSDLNDILVKIVDKRVKELEINNQELLSSNKVTIRCNATMHYRVANGLEFLNGSEDSYEFLYKMLQFAIREHLGRLNIDEILSMQHTIKDEILIKLRENCSKVGVMIDNIHIKDIILPGEMRDIFNKVIEASKRAEANNIARREETAAMRSMLNTAKLMKDNPAVARLKELEALEKVVAKVGTLNVYGGLNEVMNGIVRLEG